MNHLPKKRVTILTIVALLAVLSIGILCGFSEDSSIQPYAALAALPTSEVVGQVTQNVIPTSLLAQTPAPKAKPDRTKPLYTVTKDGWPVEVDTHLQWYIRDLCWKYEIPERMMYGCILAESCFDASAGSTYKGLLQIENFWIRGAGISHFTDTYQKRDLYNPYDNVLTGIEMWCYARDTYGIDLSTDAGKKDLLYWHNSGQYIENVTWKYSDLCLRFGNEIVLLQEY